MKKCPKCGAKMKKRRSKYGYFWGCSRYPKCKGIIDIDGKKRNRYSAKTKIKKPPSKEAGSSGTVKGEIIQENNIRLEAETSTNKTKDTDQGKFKRRKSGFSIVQVVKYLWKGFFFPKRKGKARRVRWYAHSSLITLPLIAIVILALGAGILTLRPHIQKYVASHTKKTSSSNTRADATRRLTEKDFHLEPCTLLEVTDGDTIKVKWRNEICFVRLLRINTPERNEVGYGEATRALESLALGRTLYLEFEHPRVYNRDKYDRLLAYIHADGKNLNIEMVRLGWTSFWTRYGKGKYEEAFIAAEKEALQAKQGLWTTRK